MYCARHEARAVLLDSTGQNRKMLELKTQVERKRRKCKVKNKIVATRGGGMTA